MRLSRRAEVAIETMFVYRFVDPDLMIEKFFEKQWAAE